AFRNKRAFGIRLFHEIARHLGFDVGVDQSIERADPFLIDRNVFRLDLHDLDFGNRRRRRGTGRCFRTAGGYSEESSYENGGYWVSMSGAHVTAEMAKRAPNDLEVLDV